MNQHPPRPFVNVTSELLQEPGPLSPCCNVATVALGIDYRCPECRRVYKKPSENQTNRKAFEK